MGLFDSNSKSSTENYNIGTGSNADNNSGAVAYGGDVHFTTTDQGAIAGGVALGQAALLAGNEAVKAALNANTTTTESAFDFGSKALDLGSYSIGTNAALAGMAVDTVAGSANSVVDKIAGFASEILANGQRATTEALGFAKNMSQSESANQSELMIKAITVLGIVAVLGFALSRGK